MVERKLKVTEKKERFSTKQFLWSLWN